MNLRRFALSALAIVILGLAATQMLKAHGPAGSSSTHEHGASAPSDFARAMEVAMDRMMADMHGGPATGNADRDFLAMMVPHHQGAVDMAELVLRHGNDPLVRQLAEDIIATQRVEIEAMNARLRELSALKELPYPALSGTRGAH